MSQNKFFQIACALGPDAPYVDRRQDAYLRELLLEGRLCHIFGAPQTGKSSMVTRMKSLLEQTAPQVIYLDMNGYGTTTGTEAMLYRSMIDESLSTLLGAAPPRSSGDANQHLNWWLRELGKLAEARKNRLVVVIDEVGLLIGRGTTLLEHLAEHAQAGWPRSRWLNFCLAGIVNQQDILEQHKNNAAVQSLFGPRGLSQSIVLDDFQRSEVHALEDLLAEQTPHASAFLDRILHWTDGHPYMTHKLCDAAARAEHQDREPRALIDALVDEHFLSSGSLADSNLAWAHTILCPLQETERSRQRRALFQQLRSEKRLTADANSSVSIDLNLAGLAKTRLVNGVDELIIRNRIVESVFDNNWFLRNAPEQLVFTPESGRASGHPTR